jgi:hypothetical protein
MDLTLREEYWMKFCMKFIAVIIFIYHRHKPPGSHSEIVVKIWGEMGLIVPNDMSVYA